MNASLLLSSVSRNSSLNKCLLTSSRLISVKSLAKEGISWDKGRLLVSKATSNHHVLAASFSNKSHKHSNENKKIRQQVIFASSLATLGGLIG